MEVTPELICHDILTLLGRFKQEMMRIAEERHLTLMQLSALYQVDQHGELAMGKVAHVLHCDPSNVTGIVDRLVAQELVSRQECPTDRRAKTIALTHDGKDIVKEIMRIMPERMGCYKLTAEECRLLHTAVMKLAA